MKPNYEDRVAANRLWYEIGDSQDDTIIEAIAQMLADARARERKRTLQTIHNPTRYAREEK